MSAQAFDARQDLTSAARQNQTTRGASGSASTGECAGLHGRWETAWVGLPGARSLREWCPGANACLIAVGVCESRFQIKLPNFKAFRLNAPHLDK